MPRGAKSQPLSRIENMFMPVTESGCWIWMLALGRHGYGSIKHQGKMLKSHRVSWMVYRGAIPDGIKVLHTCDIRCCINPDHLFLGTQADNVADMIKKKRAANVDGERNPNAKLTAEQVLEIRKCSGTHQSIGDRYGVGKSIIGYIKNRDNWRSLDE